MILSENEVLLRPIERRDLERSRRWVNDPETARGLLRALPVTEMEQERWFEAACLERDRLVWAVEAGGEHVGNAGFYHVDWLHRRAELWCLVGERDRRGQGIGRSIVRLLVGYAFDGLGLAKLYLNVDRENPPARSLYEGAGFVVEGELAQECFVGGRFRDVLRMRMLASERPR